ncbi:hypothetical protein Trydic_g13868 [Trypoxylus dichotomus]
MVLFSRNNGNQRFFACSAFSEYKKKIWEKDKQKYLGNTNHIKSYILFNKIKEQKQSDRMYCSTCNEFQLPQFKAKHTEHSLKCNISDYHLLRPSQFLELLDNPKKEAQYMFSKVATDAIVNIIQERNVKNVLCIGAPRIHEYILNKKPEMNSLLLDIDRRYHNFYSPLQFCWFNAFNNYFFLPESFNVFKDFIQTDKGEDFILITDPPFGGRVELLSHTFEEINKLYQKLNKRSDSLDIMWIFPYFMEPQILNILPNFNMLDYKVGYDNHPLFQAGPKGRKYGSPVRIFTNINPCEITLPSDQGYKYCNKCTRWVSSENTHCDKCNACTSKDGRTYTHCDVCLRCVKPTWKHCNTCNRCAQIDHKCGELVFEQECFHCKEKGHKKRDCPKAPIETVDSPDPLRQMSVAEDSGVQQKPKNLHG